MSKNKRVADTTTKNKKYRLVPEGPDADNSTIFQLGRMDATKEVECLQRTIREMHYCVYGHIPMHDAIDAILVQLDQIPQDLEKISDWHNEVSDIYVMEEV